MIFTVPMENLNEMCINWSEQFIHCFQLLYTHAWYGLRMCGVDCSSPWFVLGRPSRGISATAIGRCMYVKKKRRLPIQVICSFLSR